MVKRSKIRISKNLEVLLPWHATGTLSRRQADQVESALEQDREMGRRFTTVCEEMAETISLNEALGAPSARLMNNLFDAIDEFSYQHGWRARAKLH